jgi:hypothetical protein
MWEEKAGYKKKGPLGGAGPGKGGNLKRVRYLFFFFAFFFAAIIFPLLCWSLDSYADNHNLWSRTTLPLYVVGFTFYVKKNLTMKGFIKIFSGFRPAFGADIHTWNADFG